MYAFMHVCVQMDGDACMYVCMYACMHADAQMVVFAWYVCMFVCLYDYAQID
jgi:hypothetical protein